jgi:hypothetical protein
MSEQTWFEIVGTRLQDQSKDKRSVRLIVAVDNIDDEKKERSLYDCKLRAADLIIVALPDFRPEPHEVTFKPEKIEKPDDDKLIALAGVPTFRDGKFTSSATNQSREPDPHMGRPIIVRFRDDIWIQRSNRRRDARL